MAKIIRANGTEEELKTYTLEDLQKAVGGYIEALQVGEQLMYVNEMGKLEGLPFNKRATDFARGVWNDVILGDVVLLSKEETAKESDDC